MSRAKNNGQAPPRKLPPGTKQYEIDWDKVTTVEDLKGVLQTFGLVFTCPPANVDHIKHLVKPAE